jgi:DUF4097 and DUF4098 domain-containing protein YvlB
VQIQVAAMTVAVVMLGATGAAAQQVRVEVKVLPEIARDVVSGLADLGSLGLEAVVPQNRTFRSEKTDRQTRTLTLGTSGSLELKNVSGDITVTAGGGRTATVNIVRTSRGRTDADASLGLDKVTVDVNQSGDRAMVQTRYAEERHPAYEVSVSYTVTAPAGTRVTIGSISGDTHVTGIHGDLSVNVISGDVTIEDAGRVALAKTISGDVTITGATTDGTIDTGSISGDISLRRIHARRITASVISGSVTAQEVTCDAAQIGTTDGDVTFAGPVARNGRYELKSFSGDVHFEPAGRVGFELQANTFSGDIQLNPALTLHDVTKSRRTFRGSVGDGSAVVTITTFSGDIRIGSR